MVQRYNFYTNFCDKCEIDVSDDGDYVSYEAYQKLQSKNERLKELLTRSKITIEILDFDCKCNDLTKEIEKELK